MMSPVKVKTMTLLLMKGGAQEHHSTYMAYQGAKVRYKEASAKALMPRQAEERLRLAKQIVIAQLASVEAIGTKMTFASWLMVGSRARCRMTSWRLSTLHAPGRLLGIPGLNSSTRCLMLWTFPTRSSRRRTASSSVPPGSLSKVSPFVAGLVCSEGGHCPMPGAIAVLTSGFVSAWNEIWFGGRNDYFICFGCEEFEDSEEQHRSPSSFSFAVSWVAASCVSWCFGGRSMGANLRGIPDSCCRPFRAWECFFRIEYRGCPCNYVIFQLHHFRVWHMLRATISFTPRRSLWKCRTCWAVMSRWAAQPFLHGGNMQIRATIFGLKLKVSSYTCACDPSSAFIHSILFLGKLKIENFETLFW